MTQLRQMSTIAKPHMHIMLTQMEHKGRHKKICRQRKRHPTSRTKPTTWKKCTTAKRKEEIS